MKKLSDLRVALVYDKVNTRFGGAEHVLKAIREIFPKAPLHTSVYDPQRAEWAKDFVVKTSWLQRFSLLRNRHQLLAALMPLAFESLDLSEYDLVISITSAEAKGVLTKPEQLHVCYLLTPPRYLYSHRQDYLDSHWFARLLVLRQVARLLMRYLTWWDKGAASRPDHIIPISKLVQARATSIYRRKTEEVIYPPVPKIQPSTDKPFFDQKYLLSVSRAVPYKRLDLAVEACLITGETLVLAGTGIELARLKNLAGNKGLSRGHQESLSTFALRANNSQANILFTNNISDEELSNLLSNSEALLMPGLEDFGITAMQANQLGKPVVLQQKSGAAELLSDSEAIFLENETLEEMVQKLNTLKTFTFKSQSHKQPAFTALFSQKVYDLFRTHQLTVKKGQS